MVANLTSAPVVQKAGPLPFALRALLFSHQPSWQVLQKHVLSMTGNKLSLPSSTFFPFGLYTGMTVTVI